MTAALLCELTRRGIKVVFCDEKRNPYGEILPYYGTNDCVEKLRLQMAWNKNTMDRVWSEIVRQKIIGQMEVLIHNKYLDEGTMLYSYAGEVVPGDLTNREGHAAKVYFNALFKNDFSRRDDNPINAALNYGYAIILSAVNRCIVAFGYSTMLGIFHKNGSNQFNLGSDLMEPFRSVVDDCVISMKIVSFEPEQKREVLNVLNKVVMIDGKRNYVINAIRIFVQSFFTAMEAGDPSLMKFHKAVRDEAEIHESDGFL